jgi:talin
MLINAVKDVASALGDLIQATKAASGKTITDPSMNHLKESAKVINFFPPQRRALHFLQC